MHSLAPRSVLVWVFVMTGIVGLGACGKKGPLYLPESAPPPATEAATPAPPPVLKE